MSIKQNTSMYSKEIREKTGVSRDTLRHYVEIGLLKPDKDPKNEYLIYSEKDLETLNFILQAKNLGFSLEEIGDIENKISEAICPHQSILPDLYKKLDSVQEKIKTLKIIEKHFKKIITDFKKKDCRKEPSKLEL